MNDVNLFFAAGLASPEGFVAVRAAVLVERTPEGGNRLLASGGAEEVERHPAAASARRVDLVRSVLLPGFVNAHTHLDLTHLGPQPYDPALGFVGFASTVMGGRLSGDPEALRRSVRLGIERALVGGVVAVGDISGDWRTEPAEELAASGLLGTSYLEFFGMGERQDAAAERAGRLLEECLARLGDQARIKIGLQPHAPYTVGPRLYGWAAGAARERGVPIATHLAENLPERELVAHARGPFRGLLTKLGMWGDAVAAEAGVGVGPITHLREALGAAPFLLAHVNDAADEDIEALAAGHSSVAYCPRSSSYFLNHLDFGPHRYRDMLKAGVNVCLGTDSIINLPLAAGGGAPTLGTLDEARYLWLRDRTDPFTLLRMATTNGARALGLDPSLFDLSPVRAEPRAIAGLVAVEVDGDGPSPLEAVLGGSSLPKLLLGPQARP